MPVRKSLIFHRHFEGDARLKNPLIGRYGTLYYRRNRLNFCKKRKAKPTGGGEVVIRPTPKHPFLMKNPVLTRVFAKKILSPNWGLGTFFVRVKIVKSEDCLKCLNRRLLKPV